MFRGILGGFRGLRGLKGVKGVGAFGFFGPVGLELRLSSGSSGSKETRMQKGLLGSGFLGYHLGFQVCQWQGRIVMVLVSRLGECTEW